MNNYSIKKSGFDSYIVFSNGVKVKPFTSLELAKNYIKKQKLRNKL